jgi:hypothetical protein
MSEKIWAWQPFGPDDGVGSFTIAGSHYRGFPVIKVTDEQKRRIEASNLFEFKFKGVHYVAIYGRIEKVG